MELHKIASSWRLGRSQLLEKVPTPGHTPDSELVCDGYGVAKVVRTHKIVGQGRRVPRPIEYVGAGIWVGKCCPYGK
jgi:hypothetical protein